MMDDDKPSISSLTSGLDKPSPPNISSALPPSVLPSISSDTSGLPSHRIRIRNRMDDDKLSSSMKSTVTDDDDDDDDDDDVDFHISKRVKGFDIDYDAAADPPLRRFGWRPCLHPPLPRPAISADGFPPFHRRVSMEDASKYLQEVTDFQGFDVSAYKGTTYSGYIRPMKMLPEDVCEGGMFFKLGEIAVSLHNQGRVDTDDDFIFLAAKISKKDQCSCGPVEFGRILKLNVCVWHYLITLEAKDLADGNMKIYQAILFKLPGQDASLKLFRMKPGT